MLPSPDMHVAWRDWARALVSALGRRRAVMATVLPLHTVAELPSAAVAGSLIYVSDETGGAVVAFSDGTDWRRVTDRAVVS